MRRVLDAPVPAPAWPDGVCLSSFTPDQAQDAHALLVRCYEHGGGTVGAFDEWWPALLADPEFDSALCFVARRIEGDMVGIAQCWTSAFVKDLVVHPSWRRRGVGEALLLHAFGLFRARGAKFVDLKVLDDNPSGAYRLYSRVGMIVAP
jgi:ribosomal protein S18 acetylase RimI-like enzyme